MPAFRPDGRTPVPTNTQDPDNTKTVVNFSLEDLQKKRAAEAAAAEQATQKSPEQTEQPTATGERATEEKQKKSPKEIFDGLWGQIDVLAKQAGSEGKLSPDETIKHLDSMAGKIAEKAQALGLSAEQVKHLQRQCEEKAEQLLDKTPERLFFFGLMTQQYTGLEVLIPPPPAEQKAMLVAIREADENDFDQLGYKEVGKFSSLKDTQKARALVKEFGGTEKIKKFHDLKPVADAAQARYQSEADASRAAHKKKIGEARIIRMPTPEVLQQLEGIGFVVRRIQQEYAQPIAADTLDSAVGYIMNEVTDAVEQYAAPYRGEYNMARQQFEVKIQVRPNGFLGRFSKPDTKRFAIDVYPTENMVRINPKG